jgi:hypothetical protein
MAEARPYPPSEQRIAEARRAGHVPRTSLVAFAALWGGLSLGLAWCAPAFQRRGGALFARALSECCSGAARGGGARGPWSPEHLLRQELPGLVGPLLLCCAGAWLLALCACGVAQGMALRWPFARAPRRRFARAAAPRIPRLLAGLLSLACGFAGLRELLAAEPDQLGATLSRAALRLGAAWIACAVIDAALARGAFFRALWLTRREQRDEQREVHGAPELRAARAQARAALGAPPRGPDAR